MKRIRHWNNSDGVGSYRHNLHELSMPNPFFKGKPHTTPTSPSGQFRFSKLYQDAINNGADHENATKYALEHWNEE